MDLVGRNFPLFKISNGLSGFKRPLDLGLWPRVNTI